MSKVMPSSFGSLRLNDSMAETPCELRCIRWAHSWLAQEDIIMPKSVFDRRFLLAALTLGALGSMPACMAVADVPPPPVGEPAEPQNVSLPEGFPETINFPAGSRIVSASGGQPPEYASRSYQVDGQVSDTVDSVVAFFTAMIEKNGYEIVEVEKGNATLIRFDTIGLDDASVMVMDMFGDGTTSFSISLIMDPEPE
ncbi:MAG: hypothetical protein V7741_09950 [Hyphomonas sp.]